jgi:FG-GAP-like repeat/FG-GAP repeat
MSRKNTALQLLTFVFVVLLVPAALNASTLFKTTKSYETGGYDALSIAVGDVNGDGKLDVIVANTCGSGCGGLGLVLLLGNGDGTFGAPHDLGDHPYWFTLADVNGDGYLDLIEAFEDGYGTGDAGVNLRLGNGDGTFQVAQSYSLGGGGGQIAIAVSDLNGDGNADLIALTTCAFEDCSHAVLGVLLGNGDGTFQAVETYAAGCGGVGDNFPYDAGNLIALTDANRDGKLDIVIGSQCGTVGVFFGNGDGTFQAYRPTTREDHP